jgi:signal transduction histidine kinase
MQIIMSSMPSSRDPHDHGLPGQATKRAALEKEAMEIAERLPELAAGVAILGDDTEVSSRNPQATAITGYTLEEVRQAGLSSLFEPQAVMRQILHKGAAGVPTPSENLQLRHAHGHLCPVVVQCAPQRQLKQNACHLVLVIRTIDLPLDNLRQDEHVRVMGRFASSLSHEIRNQLNAVMLHTDVLQDVLEDVPSDETRHLLAESVVDIRHEVSRLHELVENFLTLARMTHLDLTPVMLETVIEALNEEIAPVLSSQGIQFYQDLSADLGEVALHPNTFRHLWLNLIHNAMDAMPAGGALTNQTTRSGDEVSLTITETGAVIAADQLPLIFVPFHTSNPDGTGLGLYIVQEVASVHRGRIDVTSELGVGTSFTVTLPMWKPDENTPDTA